MALIYDTDVDRLDLGDGEWADMKKTVCWADLKNMSSEDEDELKDGKNPFRMLLIMLVKWNIKDKDGKVAEISRENLERLELRQLNFLTAEVNWRIRGPLPVRQQA